MSTKLFLRFCVVSGMVLGLLAPGAVVRAAEPDVIVAAPEAPCPIFEEAAASASGSVPAAPLNDKAPQQTTPAVTAATPADPASQAVPVASRPAPKSHRFTLAEKMAAVEARKKKLAEIEAKKAGAVNSATQTGK
jgi:hypothetical protein